MFGRKKSSGTTSPPQGPSATETLAGLPARPHGLSLRKPDPARPQPGATSTVAPRLPAIPVGPRAPRAAAEKPQGEGKTLVVGRLIALSGEIAACDRLVVEGRVSAELHRCRAIEIARSGRFSGTAEVDTAEIIGRFDGELTARKLMVRGSARVSGKLRYSEITVEPGAQIRGEMIPLEPDIVIEEAE
ncbi:MAG TPA: polymer-forming cytoskeletal protein [Alphaproteobacteria bacterium]|jgi:cytoskeletal protein CcmA (bactofilin family)|nr:polymer-forming cytoskeletal protein [Alphaproteobacteria bacterium]